MQEKDIREKLNQELDEMAPDILNRILARPIEPVKSEKELFGKNKPLFKEKKKIENYFWVPAMTVAVTVCLLIALLVIKPWSLTPTTKANIAFNIMIDVNPSINIKVNEDGTVSKVEAGNKDAKKVVEKVNAKIEMDTDYNKAVQLVIKQLNKEGYLNKNKNAMLLSVVSDDRESIKETAREIKETVKKYKEKKEIKCTTVYQNCEVDDKVLKVAEKNKVSVGKAAFCMKIAEKEKVDVDNICDKNIYTILKGAEESGVNIFEQNMDEYVMSGELSIDLDVETESITGESESVSVETESITGESASVSVEVTSTEAESQSVEVTSGEYSEEQEVTTSPQVTTN